MKLETFFEKFDQLADTPNAVAKMRGLVLEWAATGKLCHDDSVKWKEGVLGDVIELISGQHLLPNEHNEERRGIPYLTGPSDFGEKSPIPTRWTDRPKVTAKPGDILITVKGSGVGKTNVLVDQPTAISRQLMAIRVTGADPDFVHVVLKRAAEHFQNAKTGIAIPGIGRREVLNLKVVLPPFAEQKRIVAKVDELMALCDQLEAQQQERETRHASIARASLARFADAPTPANLGFLFHKSYDVNPADLRKSILALAAQGRLVAQQQSEASNERDSGRSIPADATPYALPSGWIWKRLGDLVDFVGGSQPPKSKFVYAPQDGYIRLVQIRDFKSDGNLTFIPKALAKRPFKEDDVMIGRYGPPVFQILRGLSGTYNVALMKAEPTSTLLTKDFLFYLLQEPRIHGRVVADSDRTAGQSGVRKPLLESFIVGVPPRAEQRRIVAKVDQLMVLVDQLETQLANSRDTVEKLMEAVVAELTTQA